MVKKARENIEAIKKDGIEGRKGIGDMAVVLSDAGYCSEKNLKEMEGEEGNEGVSFANGEDTEGTQFKGAYGEEAFNETGEGVV